MLTAPVARTAERFCRTHGVQPSDLRDATQRVALSYGVTDALAPLDSCLVDEREWLRQVSRELDGQLRLTSFADSWFSECDLNTDWLSELTSLRRAAGDGVRLGLLSNMPPDWDRHWRAMVDPELFDHVVLSWQVGHRKPDEDMFDAAAEAAGVAPQQCVLIDDLATNCAGAVHAGWAAIQFDDTCTAGRDLHRVVAA